MDALPDPFPKHNRTMDAKELMIGDWVEITKYGFFDQIVNMQAHSVISSHGDTIGVYDYEELSYVAMSPEILEKNGFVRLPGNNWKWSMGEECITIFWEYDVAHVDAVNCTSSVKVAIVAVHELQHLLRVIDSSLTIEL